MKENTLIVLPNTIFEDSLKDISNFSIDEIVIVYDKYYFNENQHKQKLALWLSSLEEYKKWLVDRINIKVQTVMEYKGDKIKLKKENKYYMYEPLDKYIKKKYSKSKEIIQFIRNPSIILSEKDLTDSYRTIIKNKNTPSAKINIRHADFYKYMRTKLNILIDKEGNPEGGLWSYDLLNRQKFPKNYKERDIYINNSTTAVWACEKVYDEFPGAFGECNHLYYPSSFKSCKVELTTFINYKLQHFGEYQDAISTSVIFGEHSNLSAIMNIGLITPLFVVNRIVKYYYSLDSSNKKKYINSVEGFIRQIIGWREYMRFTYHFFSTKINSSAYLEKIKDETVGKIHKSWYNGTTGIYIFDNLIHKIRETGYAHHIERLMILNNSLIMYGFSRKEINKWFMYMFVDSYDWVMTSCVCMNHNSLNDKFKYMNRVYIAGDNYIKKMSDYKDKDSLDVMKSLFRTFTKNHSNILRSDYNLASYIARQYNK